MSERKTVTVYSFWVQEFLPESATLSTFKASREQIQNKLKGQVLEGTGEQVLVSELDSQGRLRRIATGWSELARRLTLTHQGSAETGHVLTFSPASGPKTPER